MIPTAPPIIAEPPPVYIPMPVSAPPPAAPVHSKSRALDVLKLLLGFVIALLLAAILAVLIFAPNKSNENIAKLQRESNENIAKLQRESNENIALLEREQMKAIEEERERHGTMLLDRMILKEIDRFAVGINITENQRIEDRLIAEKHRAEDFEHALSQAQLQLEIEQRRFELLLEERKLAEERRREDLSRANAELVSNFLEKFVYVSTPLNIPVITLKVRSLIRQLDAGQKSSLIDNLYKTTLLSAGDPNNPPLDLHGVNLTYLNLDGIDTQSSVGPSESYTGLALSSTNLANASFDHLYLDYANFSLSDLMGASFLSSRILHGNFTSCLLSESKFNGADISGSIFSKAKIRHGKFTNAILFQTQMDNADIGSSNFQYAKASEANFSRSEMSDSDFQHANLSYAQLFETSARSVNFYFAKAIGANFSHAYVADSNFLWADLREASFRDAPLFGTNFENADVRDVDFTRARLSGVNITRAQLDTVLSITNATLPDGSKGKNKNLVQNSQAQCSDINGTISNWTVNGNVFISGNELTNDCAFQAGTINATLQQSVYINRYQGLLKNGQGVVYIEMQDKTTAILNPSVYMRVRFFDAQKIEIAEEGKFELIRVR